jgi:hypothetical protein
VKKVKSYCESTSGLADATVALDHPGNTLMPIGVGIGVEFVDRASSLK